jgi:hypothetical protein
MGDMLKKLPTTRGISHDDPSHIQLLTTIFGKERAAEIETVCSYNKEILVAAILFMVVNIPVLPGIISKIYKNSENPWIMLILKTIIFTILLFFFTNTKFVKNQ